MNVILKIIFLFLLFGISSCKNEKIHLEAIDLVVPLKKENKKNQKSLKISINDSLEIYIENQKVQKENFEKELLRIFKSNKCTFITIKVGESVNIKNVIYIMNIANKHKIKSSLAVRSK